MRWARTMCSGLHAVAYTSRTSREDVADLASVFAFQVDTLSIHDDLQELSPGVIEAIRRDTSGYDRGKSAGAGSRKSAHGLFNKFGHLVLTTGNKSEMSVGYATLYGDMAGDFAVIKDVPKTMVYELSHLRNLVGPEPVIPKRVLERPPTAELRPDQKDEDSLPPYAILDPILKAYVEEDRALKTSWRWGSRGDGRARDGDGRSQRVQTQASAAGHQDYASGIRQRSPDADHQRVSVDRSIQTDNDVGQQH